MRSHQLSWKQIAACLCGLFLMAASGKAPAQEHGGGVKPLPDTAEGQPINSLQSEASLLNYLDHETQERIHVEDQHIVSQNSSTIFYTDAQLIIPGGLGPLLTPAIAKFGFANLLVAQQHGPNVRQGDLSDTMTAQLKTFEKSIIDAALHLTTVSADDLPTLITNAKDEDTDKDATPLTTLILGKKDWANNPTVDQFALDKLNAATSFSATNSALLQYATASSNPKLQAKAADFLKTLLRDNSSDAAATDMHIAIDDLLVGAIESNNAGLLALMPEWASARVQNFQQADLSSMQPQETRGPQALSPSALQTRVTQAVRAHPEALANASLREGVKRLLAPLAGKPGNEMEYDYLAGAAGDKNAFLELARVATPASTGPVTLNGNHATADGAAPYAKDLLALVTYQGSGDATTGILAHLDSAVYNNDKGQWTVTDSQFVAATPAAPSAPATGASPAAAPAALSAPATPTGPVTATVITATKIESRTPSGGLASIPLDVGAKLTIVSVESDGTVKAKTDFGFEGTVPKAALQMSDAAK